MDLTAEQLRAVEHEGPGPVVVAGGPGTGKTAVLVARYRRLVARHPASRVLVVCRDRAAAQRFIAAVLGDLRGGFDALPITTVHGLAYDLVARSGGPVTLAGGSERRALLRRVLAADPPGAWPTLHPLVARRGFVEEVAAGLSVVDRVGVEAAEAAGGAWAELGAFTRRYRAVLEERGHLDAAGLVAAALPLAPSHAGRFDHVLVDDAGTVPPAGVRLLAAIGGTARTIATDVDPAPPAPLVVRLTRSFRAAAPGTLVECRHPSVEAEAVAGELLAAHRAGVPWAEMAVLVRGLGRRARAVGRALARHGIPAVPVPALAPEEPVVRAVIDLLRWVDGDEDALRQLVVSPASGLDAATARAVRRDALAAGHPLEADPRLAGLVALRERLRHRRAAGDTPADLAYEAWAGGIVGLDATGSSRLGAFDDRALDALVSFIDGLSRHGERHPDASLTATLAAVAEGAAAPEPWRAAAPAGAGGVAITSIEGAAGREWHTVVVAGCVEGELPRPAVARALFDPELLGQPPPGDAGEERRLFELATTRATTTLVATAAPEPGVLLSRFVEAWPTVPPRLPLAPGQPPPRRAVTAGPTRVFDGGRLTLSATQLDTYDDCPLRYAYQYVLRARDEPGVHANLGTLAHQVLAAFLDPSRPDPPPRTRQGLLDVAEQLWNDSVARYRPQIEEARRDLLAMLEAWWEEEGCRPLDVVATERRFEIDVGPHRLVGSIDRIDRVEDGSIRVVDYKTGKREPRVADMADDLQLAVYHLAATRDPDLAALGPPAHLELRYLRSMHAFRQPVTDDHATRTEERVLDVAGRILAEEFEPALDAQCRTCSFHRLCPLQPEGRHVEGGGGT